MRLGASQVIAAAAAFALATSGVQAAMVVNEIMYNSRELPDVEYIELHNTGPGSVNMAGWYLLDDTLSHPRCYLSGTLASGAYWVVPGTTSSFTAKYPTVTNLNPNPFMGVSGNGFSLGNSNDDVRLYDPNGVLVDRVSFTDAAPWPLTPDGDGPSLELFNPTLDNTLPTSWGGSVNVDRDGTPGAINSTFHADQLPIIQNVSRSIATPASGDVVTVTARVTDDHALASVVLKVDEGNDYVQQPMYDDGAHGDQGIADSIYGALILSHPAGTVVRYYVAATDSIAQVKLDPSAAPAEHYGYTVGYVPYQIVINEVMPKNENGILDESGQREDWLELRNREPFAIDIGGMFMSDRSDQPRKWRIPDGTVIGAGQRQIVWCDSDVNQGPLHSAFKLNASGGQIGLFESMDRGNVPVHVLTYGVSGADISFGYFPEDADAPEYLDAATPGASNVTSTLHSPVCINEVLTASAAGGVDDWVELYNRSQTAVDISGWHLTDNLDVCAVPPANDYTFPSGTIIPAGGFFTVDELVLQFGWDLNGSDLIMLVNADCVTGQDYFDEGPQLPDVSQGRLPNGGAHWRFVTPGSRGSANVCPNVPPSLPRVSGLRFNSRIELVWNSVAGADAYDIVRGGLGELRGSAGNFEVGINACLESTSRDARSWDDAIPAPGTAIFYVTRARSLGCDTGSFDEGIATQIGGRDAEIQQASGRCP